MRAALLGRYRGVSVLCVVVALNSFGMGAIAPVLPLFLEQEYGVSAAEIGITIGLFGFGRLVTSLPAGYLAQRYGRKGVLGLGAAINVVGAAMVSVSFSYAWLTGWRFVSGFGGSIFLTVATIYLRDEATPATRGRLLSLQELSILAGQIPGAAAGWLPGEYFRVAGAAVRPGGVDGDIAGGNRAGAAGIAVAGRGGGAATGERVPFRQWRTFRTPTLCRRGRGGRFRIATLCRRWGWSGAATRGAMWRLMLSPAFIFRGAVRPDDRCQSAGGAVQRDAAVWAGQGV